MGGFFYWLRLIWTGEKLVHHKREPSASAAVRQSRTSVGAAKSNPSPFSQSEKAEVYTSAFLYSENPALDAGFSEAFSGEMDKALQLG